MEQVKLEKFNFYKSVGYKNKQEFLNNYFYPLLQRHEGFTEEECNKILDEKEHEKVNQELIDYFFGNEFDHKFYQLPLYFYEVVWCFFVTSYDTLNTALNLTTIKEIKDQVKTVMDYGAGIGLTTCLIAKYFNNAQVSYFDINERHRNFFAQLNKDLVDNKIIIEDKPKTYDLVFCLELFEHFHDPLEFFNKYILPIASNYMVDVSSFSIHAPGHYPYYVHDGKQLAKKHGISRAFNNEVKKHFDLVQTGWNGRPKVYKRKT